MDRKYLKVIIIILFCFILCGCSKIKVVKEEQKTKEEVTAFINKDLKSKYTDIEIKLDKIDKAYTVDKELIKNGNQYYFKIKDKNGNVAYASYKDSFKIDEEVYEVNYLESYSSIYNNKELEYYNYLVDKYIDKKFVLEKYYAADYYDNINMFSKVNVVYKLNYKLKDMTDEEYYKFLNLGYDIWKYKLNTYGSLNVDDPEVCFIFKGDKKYYCASYYGVVDQEKEYYQKDVKDNKDFTDNYNLKRYVEFTTDDTEVNKMISDFNNIGIYLIDNINNISSKYDDKFGFVLVENYTKNNHLMSLLFKFRFDSKTSIYKYESINILDTDNVNDFDGVIVNSWKK